MKVGVISDTHDRLESLKKVIEIFQENQVEMIIHCGDWVSPFTLEYFDFISGNFRVPIKSIFGNNEGDIKRIIERNASLKNPIEFVPKEVFELEIGKRKIVVYHGQDKAILESLIGCGKYDAVFTGHNHQSRNEVINKTLVLNPGTTCFAAESRIIDESSVAIYDPDSNSAQIITFK